MSPLSRFTITSFACPFLRSLLAGAILTKVISLCPFSGYPLKKIQENNEAEIMSIVCDEARDAYQSDIVVELESNTLEDLEGNVARIVMWIDQWIRDNNNNEIGDENSESK